jgi:hypothetical protein
MTNPVTLERELAIALTEHLLSILHGRVPVPEDVATLLRQLNDAIRQSGRVPGSRALGEKP